LSQPDMKREMVSPPAGAYIPSFTIYLVLPDLPGFELVNVVVTALEFMDVRVWVNGTSRRVGRWS
jgi:hypothetical protein